MNVVTMATTVAAAVKIPTLMITNVSSCTINQPLIVNLQIVLINIAVPPVAAIINAPMPKLRKVRWLTERRD